MRRVSSRQRLVSWDAFDANARSGSIYSSDSSFAGNGNDADSESYGSGYETAQSQTFYSSTNLMGFDEAKIDTSENNKSDPKDMKHWMRRRKRDRRSLKSLCTERTSVCENVEIPKSRPSVTPTSANVPNIVPSHSWEIAKPTTSTLIQFNDLIDDLHLGIFSFLDLSSLRSIMFINRHYRKLMTTDDARNSLWMVHCETTWHIDRRAHGRSPIKFVANFNLPMAVMSQATSNLGSKVGNETTDTINLSLLLSLTPTNFPTSIDKDILRPRMRLRRYIQQTIPVYRQEEEDQLIRCYRDPMTGRSIVRYTGYVGQGDRCIRTNHPLPRPSRRSTSNVNENYSRKSSYSGSGMFGSNQHHESHRPLLMNILRCSVKSMTREDSKSLKSLSSISMSSTSEPSGWAPFVVPFADKGLNDTKSTVNITPRFISYFEVSILEMEDNGNGGDLTILNNNISPTNRSPPRRTSYTDCVAVGVATRNFQFQSRMPGWDQLSYGYHGDDGGIFHSSGTMLKQFGPKYGPGDTVGCGIDYIANGIFYTLNGAFLGYAWERISDDKLLGELFPVVGVDTNAPIHINFGSADSGPFQFDLSNFIMKHEKIISSIYSLDRLHHSDNVNDAVRNTGNDNAINNSSCSSSGPSSRRQRKSFDGKRNNRGR